MENETIYKTKKLGVITTLISLIILLIGLSIIYYMSYFNDSIITFVSYMILPLLTVFLFYKALVKGNLDDSKVSLVVIILILWGTLNVYSKINGIANFGLGLIILLLIMLSSYLLLNKKGIYKEIQISLILLSNVFLIYNCISQLVIHTFPKI